ncbi:MAG: plasmid pRiA4b ORF-3 family protein [Vallitaleaceae bacterium]|nr:plasmid pRiA4b ORF-3 family protein [Vallitaleaceae bacterium]
MKSYIIKIEFEESNPLIWRRVIMPASATYKRLHDVIQNVTNFQSGYPGGGYHLYEFNLPKENRIVTDNEEAYMEHQHYIKNKQYYDNQLKSMPANMLQFEKNHQERLKIEVRKPTGLKIDDYLEKYKEIQYHYDFGDDCQIVLLYKDITRYRRKSLIENRIAFVIEDGQMYLPFLGLDLKKGKNMLKKK